MKIPLQNGRRHSLSWLCFALLGLAFTYARPATTPFDATTPPTRNSIAPQGDPVFIDPVPDDQTLACLSDLPAPVDLRALTMDNDTLTVSPIDNPPAHSLDACVGGTITRTWTAVDTMGNMASVSQQFTIAADTEPPAVNFTNLADTVSCDIAFGSTPNPLQYSTWLNSRRIAFATNLSDSCVGGATWTDNNPVGFNNACGTSVLTFNYMDGCGNADSLSFTFTTIDTIAPVFVNPPNDTVISCAAAIPDTAMVLVTDNCAGTYAATLTGETNSQLLDGSCAEYEYLITRTWEAADSCGQMVSYTQRIEVVDNASPTFTVPADAMLSCTQDYTDLSLTGEVTDAMDDCSVMPEIVFADSVQVSPSCPQNLQIVRYWTVSDVCGNATGKVQLISVSDNDAPTFDVPDDITVDCSEADELFITGEPTNLLDDCDPLPTITFSDVIAPGSCDNESVINRTWTARDACNNFRSLLQVITVIDEQAPVFQQNPQDLTLDCVDGIDVAGAFAQWTTDLAQAMASDNCTQPNDLRWIALNSGTADTVSLPTPDCSLGNGLIMQRSVDFIVVDECDNRDTLTATFSVQDNIAPALIDCPSSLVVPTDPGQCTAEVTFTPPLIEDACALDTLPVTASQSAPIVSQAAPGNEGNVPVDPIELSVAIPAPLPINAATPGSLAIVLTNADAEGPDEYFEIYGEDGSLLGQTAASAMQCGTSTVDIALSIAQINSWASDGTITILLQPNIPANQPPSDAINALCTPQGSATATLSFTAKNFDGLRVEYAVDGGSRTLLDPVAAFDLVLDQGNHLLTYYATDCAGNVDSCLFAVLVEDQEPPVLDCPADVTLTVAADSCEATMVLPLPDGITDNCAVFTEQNFVLPQDTAGAYLTFNFDNNLTDYLAEAKTMTFTNVSANTFMDVELTFVYQGDFTGTGAFAQFLGDDGTVLYTTTPGDADCATANSVTVTVAAATFNAWAADGQVSIQFVPNPINVPPGVPGDGINPCHPAAVSSNGDVDSTSYVFVALSYPSQQPFYFTTGATQTGLTPFLPPAFAPQLTFAQGETTVGYVTSDLVGNTDTCTYIVTVEDTTQPTAICQPTTLFINPSGVQIEVVDPATVDNGSFDNCGIDSMWLAPNIFDCTDAGTTANVTLSVRDSSGNIGTCTTIVAIGSQGPMPTANSGLCGGDTLFLFANPPPSTGGVVYSFRWFKDDVLFSTQENPVIVGIDSDDEGAYRVEVTGTISGCVAEGIVIVNIEDLPLAPTLETPTSLCAEDAIQLTTDIFPMGNNVTFYWYQGVPPNGTLIGTSNEPQFTLTGPHPVTTRSYYLTVEANGCVSAPSTPVAVTTEVKPMAEVSFADTLICAGETLTLGSTTVGTGLVYEWTGPNSFASTNQFPTIGPLTAANDGYYLLRVRRNGCFSAFDSTLVSVKPKPTRPIITANSPLCAGTTLVLQTSATGASAYTWIGPDNSEYTTTVPSLTVADVDMADAGGWRVYITRNGCDSDASIPVIVTVNAFPEATATATPMAVCTGSTTLLQGFSNISGVTYSWTGPNTFTASGPNPQVSNVTAANAGMYRVIVTTAAGCTDTAEVVLDVLPLPVLQGISDNATACLQGGEDIVLTAVAGPGNPQNYTYQWTGPNTFSAMGSSVTITNVTPAAAGTYSLVVRTAAGCAAQTASYTLDLNFGPVQPIPPMVIGGTSTFCEGETIELITNNYIGNVTYLWQTPSQGIITTTTNTLTLDNVVASDSGPYRVTVLRDGCMSALSPSQTLTISPTPQTVATSNSPVCEGDDLILDATVFPGATYSWGGPFSFNSSLRNPVREDAATAFSGQYFVVPDISGCYGDTTYVDVTVKDRPTAPILLPSDAVCVSDPAAVLDLLIDTTGVPTGTYYQWYIGNGNTPLGDTTDQALFQIAGFSFFTGNGDYTFYATATRDDCTSELSAPLIVRLNDIPDQEAFAGMDTTACSGQFVLQAAAPTIGTGMWSFVGDPGSAQLVNPTQANSMLTGLTLADETYTLRWTLSNGACTNYDSDEVTIQVSAGEAAVAGDDIRVCDDEVVIICATPPVGNTSVGTWLQGGGQQALGVVIVNPGDPCTPIEGLEPDNVYSFTWRVSSACGEQSDEILVFVSDPEPDAGPDQIACGPEPTAFLSAIEPLNGSTGSWSSPDPIIEFGDLDDPTTDVLNLSEGENILIWTIDAGICGDESRDTVIVVYKTPAETVADTYTVPFNGEREVEPLENDFIPAGTTIAILQGPERGQVMVVDGQRLLYIAPANFVGTEQVTYLAVSNGCTEVQGTITFVIGDGVGCVPPNLFTPNGDGVNDAFVIPCLLDQQAFPRSQVVVYNSWGDEVFRSAMPYNNNWRGTFSGEPLPDHTYYYVIDLGDGSEPLTGFVVIQR